MNYLKLDSFVNDFSNVLNQENISEFNEKFFNYEKTSGIQIATIFIKNREGKELKDISLNIFNGNGIGYKQTNSGLLLVVVTDEKKIRITTGKGMEIEFPDSLASDIIEGELRGLLNSGNYIQLLKSWYELSTKSRNVKINQTDIFINSDGKNYSGAKKGFIPSDGKNYNLSISQEIKEKSLFKKFLHTLFIILFLIGGFLFFFFTLIFLSIIFPGFNGTGSSSSSSSSSYDSDYDSDYDSSSSSSDWGGGSSNGGGRGD